MREYFDEKPVKDAFQAFLVEGASFTLEEEYPILRAEMVPPAPPKRIMSFKQAITCRGDLSETVIYTFCPDDCFERVRRNPRRYLNFFKRTAGMIGFDFSVHDDMPLVKQKSQLNDNLSLTYFYGASGVPIYPSCRCGSESLEDEYLAAFPKKTLLVLGVHGFIKRRHQRHEWRYWGKKVIDTLSPTGLVIVGHLDKKTHEYLSSLVPIYTLDTLIDERNKERRKHVNKRPK